MKRSNFIKLIKLACDEECDYSVEFILDKAEDLGIKPPGKNIFIEYNNPEMEKGIRTMIDSYTWEPENEEK